MVTSHNDECLPFHSLRACSTCLCHRLHGTGTADSYACGSSVQGAADQQKPPRRARSFELHAITPEFWDVFDKNATLTTMETGFGFTEGPVWDPTGFLWVSDESKNEIDKLYPDGRVENMVSWWTPTAVHMTGSTIC